MEKKKCLESRLLHPNSLLCDFQYELLSGLSFHFAGLSGAYSRAWASPPLQARSSGATLQPETCSALERALLPLMCSEWTLNLGTAVGTSAVTSGGRCSLAPAARAAPPHARWLMSF